MFKFLMSYYVNVKKVKGVWYGQICSRAKFQTVPEFLLEAGQRYLLIRKDLEKKIRIHQE